MKTSEIVRIYNKRHYPEEDETKKSVTVQLFFRQIYGHLRLNLIKYDLILMSKNYSKITL